MNRIEGTQPPPQVETIHVASSTERQTEPGRFEAALRGAADGLARGVVAGVEAVAPLVPGGTVLSGAVRGAMNGAAAPRGGGLTGHAGGALGAAPAPGAGGGEDDLLSATRQLQAEARTYNLQYLQLQESLQRESREFSALTNVMKVKHDTAKGAIANIH
ncbi:MAG: hypothetical protein U0229_12295 [Anaeromyxobacter sp.]